MQNEPKIGWQKKRQRQSEAMTKRWKEQWRIQAVAMGAYLGNNGGLSRPMPRIPQLYRNDEQNG